jgi:DNA-directed RNA polymerase specialized sigma subunit
MMNNDVGTLRATPKVRNISDQVRDFVEYYGKNFTIDIVSEYLGCSESQVKHQILKLVNEGVVIRLRKVNRIEVQQYAKRKETDVVAKKSDKLMKIYRIEKIKAVEQAKIFLKDIDKQITSLVQQKNDVDRFIKEMEGLL